MSESLLAEKDAARFWSRVDVRGPNDCWPWTACVNRDGYGYIGIGGRSVGAHRLSLIISTGADRPGLQALHNCDRPSCCNPAHLRFGTIADNFEDMRTRGRRRLGERHGGSVLTDALVIELRRRVDAGEPVAWVASDMGLNRNTAYFAAKRRTWKHLP